MGILGLADATEELSQELTKVSLQGRKTILGGAILIGAGIGGVFYGMMSPADGVAVVGVGISICGLAAKANRHQAEILAALGAVAVAGADLRKGDRAGAQKTVQAAAAAILGEEMPAIVSLASAPAAEPAEQPAAPSVTETGIQLPVAPSDPPEPAQVAVAAVRDPRMAPEPAALKGAAL